MTEHKGRFRVLRKHQNDPIFMTMCKYTTGNSKGTTLVELLVILGIMGIIAFGVMSLFQSITTMQTQSNVVSTLQTLSQKFQVLAKDQRNWSKSIADTTKNPQLGCLDPNAMTNCTAISADPQGTSDSIVGYPLALYDAGGLLVYDSTVAANGFRVSGEPCSTYSSAGNDSCPIRYNISWKPMCPSSGACRNPAAKIIATAVYSPSASGTLLKHLPVNLKTYSFVIVNGGSITYEPFMVYHQLTGNTVANRTEGACNLSGWGDRVMSLISDPSNSQNASWGSMTNSVRFKAGTYQCQFSAPAFQVKSFKIRLAFATSNTAVNTNAYAGGYAGADQMARAQGSLLFQLGADTDIKIQQTCSTTLNVAPWSSTIYDLGFATPDPGGTTYSTATLMAMLVCSKVN